MDCLCDDDYVQEDQKVLIEILSIFKKVAPVFFEDYIIDVDATGRKFGRRPRSKQERNMKVNWSLPDEKKREFGLPLQEEPKGKETTIP
jgi:hypothetical protein